MVKETRKTITYTKTDNVVVSEKRYCDHCKKEITGEHWSVTTGHNDWGNDSCESVEHHDACSPLCLNTMFLSYCERSNDNLNTQYFEVEHHRWSRVKGDIKYD